MHDRMKQEQSPEVSMSVPLLALDRIWGDSIVAIGGPSSNQAASLESQQIQQIQLLSGQTQKASVRNLPLFNNR
jgi:hypothetical protein